MRGTRPMDRSAPTAIRSASGIACTGHIDKTVAAYWRDTGYDLTWNLIANWSKIGPSAHGQDAYVRRATWTTTTSISRCTSWSKRRAKLTNPKANFVFDYGRPMKPHGWQPMTNAEMVRMMEKFRMEHRTQP